MHIPDGFLDARTAITTGILSSGSVGLALRRARKALEPRRIPLVGLTAAFIFVAQLMNFPVSGGTSGHLVGATLAAILAGPWAAILMMTNVLLIQAFLFADGGVVALGANVLNMAVVAPIVGYAVYRALCLVLPGRRGRLAAASFAAWVSAVAASLVCGVELAMSGVAPWTAIVPAMTVVHSVIGLGEGVITMLVLAAISGARPELLDPVLSGDASPRRKYAAAGLAVVACLILLVIAPFASSLPDGLESAANALGFGGRAVPSALHAPMGGYRLPGSEDAAFVTSLAGGIGAVAAAFLSFVVARVLVPGRAKSGRAERSGNGE